jgi:iron complex transport system substrate-binding protein
MIYYRFIFLLLVTVSMLSCGGNTTKNNEQLHLVSIEKPRYAKGFELHHMSDSSTRIVLFNLERAGDTLDVITWKPQSIQRIACLSTTHIAMLRKLNKLDLLKGVGFADLVQNAEAKEKIAKGEIINLTTSHDVDAEIVFSIEPEIFFVYPFGNMSYERYAQKNIPCIPISEYLEVHPLGRAEWIKVFGVLLGEPQKAEKTFETISQTYNALKEKAVQ